MNKIKIFSMEGYADVLSEDSDSVYYQFPNGRRRSLSKSDLGITWEYVDVETSGYAEVVEEMSVAEPVKPLDVFHENPETDEDIESMVESENEEDEEQEQEEPTDNEDLLQE